MQILWLVKTTLSQAAAACGLAGASDVSGSWLTGQLAALQAHPALHLTVLCVGKAEAAGRADGVDYRIVTGTAAFAPLLLQLRPDLVHIWGTEYDAAAAMAEAAKAAGLPVLFSIQGVMRDCAALAPAARYFACNETLRPLFYTGTPWRAREFGAAPVLFLPQGNYPLKNLHTALRALPAVLAAYGDAQLVIAGWPPLDKGPLLRPVIDRMFPYKRYCKQLAAELGIAGHIRYTGPLDAAAMRQAYLEADVFLLPSCCENSPNSLGEAMLLGLPCVAAAVGGIPSMLESGREGLLYGDALDDKALADAVLRILQSADGGMALGRAARARALQTHDAARNAGELEQIYKTILQEEQP